MTSIVTSIKSPAKVVQFAENSKYYTSQLPTQHTKGKPCAIFASTYHINLDWLEITLSGLPALIEPANQQKAIAKYSKATASGEIMLIHDQRAKANKHYKAGYHVLFVPNGSKQSQNIAAMISRYSIGVLSAEPHAGNNCKPTSGIFQAKNHTLYQSRLFDRVEALLAATGATVAHITRLDIAIDGKGLITPFERYYFDEQDAKRGITDRQTIAKAGKAVVSGVNTRAGKVESFYIGSKASGKQLNGYCKGQRLEVESKAYIRASWINSGLISESESGKDVQRIELRLRRTALKELNTINEATGEISAFDWQRLKEDAYLAAIFKKSCENFYQFLKVNPTDKDRSRWEKIEPIKWDKLQADAVNVVKIGRHLRGKSNVWAAKRCIKKLDDDHATSEYLADAIRHEIDICPSLLLTAEFMAKLVASVQDIAPCTSKEQAAVIADVLTNQITEKAKAHVRAWAADTIPTAMADAMAKEHDISDYTERRRRRDYHYNL